jgi:hypothetical protein
MIQNVKDIFNKYTIIIQAYNGKKIINLPFEKD